MPPKADPAVDAYLRKLPKPQRDALTKVRAELRKTLPDADEGLSYGMPAFKRGTSPIFGYGARGTTCLLAPMSGDVTTALAKDLAKFDTTKGLVKFAAATGFPAPLLRKLVKARLAELGEKTTSNAAAKPPAKARAARTAKGDDVDALLAARKHPKEKEVRALRKIIRDASPAIRERWKWNAPSYYLDREDALGPKKAPGTADLGAFNLHQEEFVQLVLLFRHGVPKDAPDWLEGTWKDRRVAGFRDAREVRARKAALQALLREMVTRAEGAARRA